MAAMLGAVDVVLEEIGAGDRPRLLVLNKADAIDDERREELRFAHADGVLVSAATGDGTEALGERIEQEFRRTLRPIELLLPYAEGARLAELHEARRRPRAHRHRRGRARARPPPGHAGRALRAFRGRKRRDPGRPGVRLAVRRLDAAARLPERAHDDDAGYDLHALEATQLAPGARAMVRTGIAIELPPAMLGWSCRARGLAARHGIALVNAPGLIDAGYRGELKVLLLNTDREAPFTVAPGDRIAQLVVVPVTAPTSSRSASSAATMRGDGGFGSSGA